MQNNNNTETEKQEKKKRLKLGDLRVTLNLLRFMKPYRAEFAVGFVFLILSTLTALVFPYAIRLLLEAANKEDQNALLDNINSIALGLLIVLLLQAVFSFLRVVFFTRVSEKTMARVRTAVYQRIISLPIPFFEKRRVGELTSRITADVTQLQDMLSSSLAELFRQIATLVLGSIYLLITATQLTLVMLATFPVIIIVAFMVGRFVRRLSKKAQDALGDANVIVEETFQSINIVKAFTNEQFESKRYNTAIGKVVGFAIRAAYYRGGLIAFFIIGIFGAIVLVMWYGAGLVESGQMTIPQLLEFILYTIFIGGSMGGMGEMYAQLQKTVGASERLQEILQQEPEFDHTSAAGPAERLTGDIAYRHINFRYPTRPDITVLKDLNLHIKSGSKVALVGPSGAGKSTIMQLLLGFYRDYEGTITIGGEDIHNIGLQRLRGNMGIVPQEVILFGGTIRENIAYGRPNATYDEIVEAARKANAMDFIESFPDQLETVVGERGIKLSGGQKQRVAIARAILNDPAILLLDEATSSLDSESEQLVQEALNELMKNRTTIVIAHRLSTIRKVDNIYVLADGEVAESGSHEELVQHKNGMYNNLLKLQFSEQE